MTIATRRALFVAVALVSLIVIRITESDARYTFGHPHLVDIAVVSLISVLGVTHVMTALIMWLQRAQWVPTDASMFCFIAIKSIFWINEATAFQFLERGITLDRMLMFALMSATTIDLDVRLFGRYVLGWEDDRLFPKSEPTDQVIGYQLAGTPIPPERSDG